MQSTASPERQLLGEAVAITEEIRRRSVRARCLTDLRLLARLLYPPEDDQFNDFWKRFGEVTHWLLVLCLAWKSRSRVEIMPGFTLCIEGKDRIIEKPEIVDLDDYKTLLILQSRETLKTAIRRIDLVHDLAFWPLVRRSPCTAAWFAHKLEEATRNSDAIKAAMCASEPFNDVWGGILVPEHRDPENWNTKEYFNTPIHPAGMPERSAQFLAVKTRFEGGRYKAGHYDDLVTGEDRKSMAIREDKKQNMKDRENERDKTVGIRIIQGTYYHTDDAYNEIERQKGVVTVKLPCLRGSETAFFDFVAMDRYTRKKKVAEYTKIVKPVFPHLGIMELADTCDNQTRVVFAGQMLLKPEAGGMNVFDVRQIMQIGIESVPEGLTSCLLCDPAFKKPENRHKGDKNAIGLVMFDNHGRIILVDGAYRNDWGESEVFAEAGRLIKAYRPFGFYMEQKFMGDINPHWMEYAYANGIYLSSIMPLKKAGSANKNLRIQTLEPYFRAGKIVLVRDAQISNAILHEAKGFDRVTGCADNDDALDMLAQALDPAVGRMPEGSWDGEHWSGQDAKNKRTVESEQEVWLP